MPKHVLIIDDDPLFTAVAEEMLLSLGVERVHAASNGAQGLAYVKATPDAFDLILCDLNMPELDGVNVVRALGELDYSGAVAIVSSEASDVIASVRMVAEMIGIRIVGGLSKPLREASLKSLLAAVPDATRSTRARVVTRADLASIIGTDALLPVYQPQLDLQRMTVCNTEALLRRRDESGDLVGASDYLLAAEKHDLITTLTIDIFERIIQDLLSWRQAGVNLGTSVNISPASLKQRDLPDALSSRMRSAGLRPSDITLEVTENRLLDFEADTLEVLARLRIAGFRLSVDDFGTGATSIEQLRRFPFTELKVDKAFVQGAASDPFARETLLTSVRLSGLLGLSTVAEGIETEDDLKTVQKAGIHKAQGYLIARPMAASELVRWMGGQPSLGTRVA